MCEHPRRGLTGGDAAVVIVLILIAVGWVMSWLWGLANLSDEQLDDMSWVSATVLGALIIAPSWKALSVAGSIIDRSNDG